MDRALRLYRLSAAALGTLGFALVAMVVVGTRGSDHAAAGSARLQGMLLACLLLELAVLFELYAAYAGVPSSPRITRFRAAGFGMVATAMANLALLLYRLPGAAEFEALAQRGLATELLAARTSAVAASGLLMTNALLALGLLLFAAGLSRARAPS